VRNFIIIWCGQILSAIGSAMTQFALIIWVWQLTETTTNIALISFFQQLPLIFVSLFAGILVDRYSRKLLIILGDTSAILCTIIIALLYATNNLQIWYLYALIAVSACFGHVQHLAYSASVSLIVPKQHYTRASSMISLVSPASAIVSPALAGILYPAIGLFGIILIDIITFAIAATIILILSVPQPPQIETSNNHDETIWQQLAFGFRYILSRPSLLAMAIAFSCFWFAHQICDTLFQPMILARTDGNTEVLSVVMTAAGVGGVIGGSFLSIWGGFKRQVNGMLLGFIGTGLSKIVLGIGQIPLIWTGASLFSSINVPLLFSSSNAIWYTKVEPSVQGRVFAADHTIGMIIGTIASLISGPIADTIFEPAMQPGGWLALIFSPIFGSRTGSGIALFYVATSLMIVLVGISGYAFPKLRNVEDILPDSDSTTV
jgi:MFS transporter, DHA3 family, macrolide efflux protein